SGSVTCGIVNRVQKWREPQRGAVGAQPEKLPRVVGGGCVTEGCLVGRIRQRQTEELPRVAVGGCGRRGNLQSRFGILVPFTFLLPTQDGRATARWPGRPGCCAPAGAERGHSVMSAR